MEKIQTEDFIAHHDADAQTVFLQGFLRLNGIEEYQPIMSLLLGAIDQTTSCIVDLSKLEFLNSSGISMLSMFVVRVRDRGNVNLVFRGSNKVLWQTRSLKNLKRLMPALTIDLLD
ncbi:slr1659 superfamily regulator [Leptolyngbya sp. PCC 6406]|uniref:slr1659 superfamily regulator n=1 Tax=Leptolyngbya sp. PCC 6406 TaxID=1173264 RepID=UPI0002AD0781|nr:hypothetical protein [Leptolyngbya sp. PCC 6406]